MVSTRSRSVDHMAFLLYPGHGVWDDFLQLLSHYRAKSGITSRDILCHSRVYTRNRWYFDCGPGGASRRVDTEGTLSASREKCLELPNQKHGFTLLGIWKQICL